MIPFNEEKNEELIFQKSELKELFFEKKDFSFAQIIDQENSEKLSSDNNQVFIL